MVKGKLRGQALGMKYEPRFHTDDRRIGWFDIFPNTVLKSRETIAIRDVNVVRIPKAGTITAWHRHIKQTDYWFVVQGQLQVGLAKYDQDAESVVDYEFTFLGPESREVLEISPPIWHGYKSLVDDTILIYGMTNRYIENHDELRCHIDDMRLNGLPINWNLGAR
jgi:dTDP-4-dehydrorhamnose 3,5-epimerase-like enzyme